MGQARRPPPTGARSSSARPPAGSTTGSTPTRRRRRASTRTSAPTATAASTDSSRSTPTAGRTSPPRTTATSCGSTSTAIQVGSKALAGDLSDGSGPADHRRQRRLGRALPGPDRRGPRSTTARSPARDRADMDRPVVAGTPGRRRTPSPDADRRVRASPCRCPITPVHLALLPGRPRGHVGRLRGRASTPSTPGIPWTRPVRLHPERPQPVLRRPHHAHRRAAARRRRSRPGLRGHQGHEPVQPEARTRGRAART